jgi:hypothetical protein
MMALTVDLRQDNNKRSITVDAAQDNLRYCVLSNVDTNAIKLSLRVSEQALQSSRQSPTT